MASRRGATRVNPVTGKLERRDGGLAEGQHRDGCVVVSDKYVNAAKDLGLGGGEGMYDHIKSLARMRAADVPVGTSMHTTGPRQKSAPPAAAPHRRPAVDARDTAAVAEAIVRTTTTTVGRARVTGFAPTAPLAGAASALHAHADAFQRRRGVVNTLGGAKDVTRQGLAPTPALPPRGSGGARIASFDTLATAGADGAARAANRARRDAANAGRGRFPQLTGCGVRVLVPGGKR